MHLSDVVPVSYYVQRWDTYGSGEEVGSHGWSRDDATNAHDEL